MIHALTPIGVSKAKSVSNIQKNTQAFEGNKQISELASIPTKNVLAQFAQISFKGNGVEADDLSAYSFSEFRGGITEIEKDKFNLSYDASRALYESDYFKAANKKIALLQICKKQGKDEDSFLLGESIHKCCIALIDESKFNEAALLKLKHSEICEEYGEDKAAVDLRIAAEQYKKLASL